MAGEKAFAKNDGTTLERAYSLHNTVKHHAADISSGSLADNGDTFAVWLTNEGLQSKDHRLTYDELADFVRDVARVAEGLRDPRKVINERDSAG